MRRRTYVKLAAICMVAVAVLVLTGCSAGSKSTGTTGTGSSTTAPSGGSTSAGATTITEQNFAFSPQNATVKAGDTVTFVNNDSAPHNVKIDGQELGMQQPGESKTWTAAKDGSYPFSCVIHPSMTGEITVGAGGSTAPAPTGGTPPAGTGGY